MPSSYPGGVKIIAGKLRGRKLKILPKEKLRPSSNRTRETLFNWLSPHIRGAQCLDLFSGSGAIGFESVSRGAGWVTMIDDDIEVVEDLRTKSVELGIDNCEIVKKEAISWLAKEQKKKYDIVYLDPPFRSGLLERALSELVHGWLSDNGLVYVELEADKTERIQNWKILRTATTKKTRYALLTKSKVLE